MIRSLTHVFAIACSLVVAVAMTPPPARANGDGGTTRMLTLGLNKSVVVDLPRDARDVLVSNPAIADAVMRSSRRIYLTSIKMGQTNIFVFDKSGTQIINLDVRVERDTSGLQQMLNRLIPDSDIRAEIMNGNVVLSGTVKNADNARRAEDLANVFLNEGDDAAAAPSGGAPAPTSKVTNLLAIQGEDQVNLRVTIAEVQRNVVKQLGIDWNVDNLNIGGALLTGVLENGFPNSPAPPNYLSVSNSEGSLSATIRTLEQTGMMRTLAEPTLTAISGEAASFLAGGEFPVIASRDRDGNTTVKFKEFGVALAFTPVVLSEGRISLRVKTEVSELSNEGAIQQEGLTIPALKVRRAETTLELPSGGAMALGGLIQDDVRQSIQGLPGLKNLPILGALFRSRDFVRKETELVIIVTPYLVRPTSRSALATPDAGLIIPNDYESAFLGRLNRVYGVQGQPPPSGTYQGAVGYIYE